MKIKYYSCGLVLMLYTIAMGMTDFKTTYTAGMTAINKGDLSTSQKAVQDLLVLRGGKPNKEIDALIRSLQGAIDKKIQEMPVGSKPLPTLESQKVEKSKNVQAAIDQAVEQARAKFLDEINYLKAENDALRNELSNAENRVIEIESTANTRIAKIEQNIATREQDQIQVIGQLNDTLDSLDHRMNDLTIRLDALKK
ncbi:MAG: hypothetical protein M1114_05965 [Candidatus Dependentiae bacterium]|nr:hypothetical protein [Candidatus Dependentiae bacterium]